MAINCGTYWLEVCERLSCFVKKNTDLSSVKGADEKKVMKAIVQMRVK